jgi:hypothetical protein
MEFDVGFYTKLSDKFNSCHFIIDSAPYFTTSSVKRDLFYNNRPGLQNTNNAQNIGYTSIRYANYMRNILLCSQ